MKRAPYTNWITPTDRAASVRTGVLMKLAADGVPPEQVPTAVVSMRDNMTKASQSTVASVPRAILLSSLLAGIPVGIVMHRLAQEARKRSAKEKDLTEQINFYNDVSKELETSLADQGVRI